MIGYQRHQCQDKNQDPYPHLYMVVDMDIAVSNQSYCQLYLGTIGFAAETFDEQTNERTHKQTHTNQSLQKFILSLE